MVASDQIAKGLPRFTAMLLWEGPNAWAIVILFILAGVATSLKVTQGTANRARAVVVGLERYAIKGWTPMCWPRCLGQRVDSG